MQPVTAMTVHSLLKDLGMFSHMKGYHYLTELILLAYHGEFGVRQMKYGYYKIRMKNGKSNSAIDRGCRYIIDQSYNRYPNLYYDLFKFTMKPSVASFVFASVEYLRNYSMGGVENEELEKVE